MRIAICPECLTETRFPEFHNGVIPCSRCNMILFTCTTCDCNIRCKLSELRKWESATVSIGGNLTDHRVICFYKIENDAPVIKETWLVHHCNVRKVVLSPYYEQVAYDGLSGFIESTF